jgi:hypothetical protein
MMKKPGKENYLVSGAKRPITLLNTDAKVQESVMAQQILSLSNEHGLPPAPHLGAHLGRSTDATPYFLLQLIHATWHNKDSVATLLLL